MKRSFPYIATATDSQLVYTDGETMEEAVAAFEQGNYLEALHLLIDAMDFDFRDRFGNADGTSFQIPHGSIVVHIDIAQDTLVITADFLKLPEKGRVAMLRQVAEMNINCLMLARFVKSGDHLKMEYSCPLTDTHPHKIHSVLHNICTVGDKYDDEFCTQFKAERCYEPRITYFPQEAVDKIYDNIQLLGKLVLDAVGEYNAQRRYGYSWTVIAASLYQISFFSNHQGQFLNEMEKAIDMLNDERPVEELVARGTAFIEKLLSMPKDELAKSLYSVDMMVSTKPMVSLQGVQESCEDLYNGTSDALQKRDFDQVVVRILHKFYQLLYDCNVPLMLEYAIVTALRKAGDCTLEEAAQILHKALGNIMEGDLQAGDDDDDDCEDGCDDEGEEDDADLAEERDNAVAAHQKIAEALGVNDILAIQQQMDEALKAGNVAEYMRLATELQMMMIKGTMNS
ncbi:MAG: YbjN domain-containing protein [Bacteroidales bacterium]|nr:YbjN domain-containing protein [Bacteroidales bacterium]MDE7126410.1 YbjN domain-containing protein [Bacteroidales bacterium]